MVILLECLLGCQAMGDILDVSVLFPQVSCKMHWGSVMWTLWNLCVISSDDSNLLCLVLVPWFLLGAGVIWQEQTAVTDGLLVCAWGEGWMGLRLLVLCLESSPLPQSVFLHFFLQACVTLSALSSLLKVKTRQIDQGSNNVALRRSLVSPGGRWRGHSSVRPIGGSTVVLWIYLEDTESLSGWMSQWSLTNTGIWNLPLTGWNPGSVLLHGQTSHDFSTPGLSSAWNYFSLKHSIETYCSSVWFIWITLRKLINPPNFWLKVNN